MDSLLPFLAAAVVGASLALSGATLQSVLRNPLAEPYILGLVGGASLGVALVYACGFATLHFLFVPLAALFGASFALVLVCGVAFWTARHFHMPLFSGQTVIIAGFVTGSWTNALQMLVLSYTPPEESAAALKWVWGSLQSATPLSLLGATLAFLLSFLILFSQNRALNALVLGEDMARALGVSPRRVGLLSLGATSLATAAAVACVGSVGFIGLIVPHLVKRLVGTNHRLYLPASALGGSLFLVGAHTLANLFPGALPVGVIAALVGTPFFLWVLCSKK